MIHVQSSIIAFAQKIIDAVGACASTPLLELTGQLPNLPIVTIRDLLDDLTWSRMPSSVQSRLSFLVDGSLAQQRSRTIERYQDTARQLHSSADAALQDSEVETRLIDVFETQYRRHVDRVRTMLVRHLASHKSGPTNPRGGFGDVSPPSSTQS